jgi:hypothetical protein
LPHRSSRKNGFFRWIIAEYTGNRAFLQIIPTMKGTINGIRILPSPNQEKGMAPQSTGRWEVLRRTFRVNPIKMEAHRVFRVSLDFNSWESMRIPP